MALLCWECGIKKSHFLSWQYKGKQESMNDSSEVKQKSISAHDDTERERFEQLFRDRYAELLVYARSLVGSVDADDVVEDAFLELWRRRKEIDMGDGMRALLYRTVYTKSLNILKHRRVSQAYMTLVAAVHDERERFIESDSPERAFTNSELGEAILAAEEELPERCRQVFRMSYGQGMRIKEIAQALNISPKTVEVHISNALRLMRKRLAYVEKGFLRLLIILSLLSKGF